MGGASDAKSHVQMSQLPGLSAEVDVPVWTSQLNVMDWQEPTGTPVNLSVSHKGVITRVEIENLLNQAFDRVWLIQSNLVFDLGTVDLGSKKVFTVDDSNGTPLESRVTQHLSAIQTAMTGRGQVMGGNEGLHIDDWANTSVAVSFPSLLQPSDPGMAHQGLAYSLGTDLMPSLQRGDSIILAWTDTSAPVPAANRFQAQRGRRACLFRMVVPRLQTIAKAASAR